MTAWDQHELEINIDFTEDFFTENIQNHTIVSQFDSNKKMVSKTIPNNGNLLLNKISISKSNGLVKKKSTRSNYLQKACAPKSAPVLLNQISTTKPKATFCCVNNGYIGQIEVNNTQYQEIGISPAVAKINAYEKAFREIILQQMNNWHSSNDKSYNFKPQSPMLPLISFALHKLQHQWNQDGFVIPGLLQESNTLSSTQSQKINCEHPGIVLAKMIPNAKYTNLGLEGKWPHIMYRSLVEVDGWQYHGCGRNKKMARRNAAAEACNFHFHTSFDVLN